MRQAVRLHFWFYSPIEVPRVPEKSGGFAVLIQGLGSARNREVIAPILSNDVALGKEEAIKKWGLGQKPKPHWFQFLGCD